MPAAMAVEPSRLSFGPQAHHIEKSIDGRSPPMLACKPFGMLPELAGHTDPHHVDLVAETKSTVVWSDGRDVPQVIVEVFDPPDPMVVQRDLNATAGDPTGPNS
jgi:hypothetical protein